MLSFSAAVEPLRMANQLSARPLFCWTSLSLDGQPVPFSNGAQITVDGSIKNSTQSDFVFVVAGADLSDQVEKSAAKWLYTSLRAGATVGSISGGAPILARAGLLGNRAFTLHWEDRSGFTERYPFLSPEDRLYCADDHVITCGGGGAATDLILHLITREFGDDIAMTVADMCVHFGMRRGEERPQSSLSMTVGSRNPHLIKAVRLMQDNLEDPLDVEVIAAQSTISRRQLERLFNTHTGRTPSRFYKDLRLDRARKLLRDTDYRIVTIAAACGFANATTFSKSFRRRFGTCPIQFRRI